MSDVEMQALIAIVNRETAMINQDTAQFGQAMWDPRTPALRELSEEMDARRAKRLKESK
jgi:hypothetical protein